MCWTIRVLCTKTGQTPEGSLFFLSPLLDVGLKSMACLRKHDRGRPSTFSQCSSTSSIARPLLRYTFRLTRKSVGWIPKHSRRNLQKKVTRCGSELVSFSVLRHLP